MALSQGSINLENCLQQRYERNAEEVLRRDAVVCKVVLILEKQPRGRVTDPDQFFDAESERKAGPAAGLQVVIERHFRHVDGPVVLQSEPAKRLYGQATDVVTVALARHAEHPHGQKSALEFSDFCHRGVGWSY